MSHQTTTRAMPRSSPRAKRVRRKRGSGSPRKKKSPTTKKPRRSSSGRRAMVTRGYHNRSLSPRRYRAAAEEDPVEYLCLVINLLKSDSATFEEPNIFTVNIAPGIEGLQAVKLEVVPATTNGTMHIKGQIELTSNISRDIVLQTVHEEDADLETEATRAAWTAKVEEARTQSHHAAMIGGFESAKRPREE